MRAPGSTTPSPPAEPYRRHLERLLREAGDAAMQRFHDVDPRLKADGSEVTEADRAAEAILVRGLAEAFPDCEVVSEEGSARPGHAGTWYVDPIDGTSAFVEGLSDWGPTVCLVVDGRLRVGAFWQPRHATFWYAERGAGAWRDGVRLRPGPMGEVDRNSSLYAPSRFHRVGPIAWRGKVRALGSTAAHLAHAAEGGAAVTAIGQWEPWDVGCGILLVEEAGRTLTDLTGAPFDPMEGPGQPFLAGAPEAIGALVHALQAVPMASDSQADDVERTETSGRE